MASILIVEDERLLGQSLRASLGDDGHDAWWVTTAEEGLDLLANQLIDVALADMRLPRMSGLEMLAMIRELHPETIVVIMTAHGDVKMAVDAMKAGAADFLLKPIDLDTLKLVAERTIRTRRMAQSLKHHEKKNSQEFGLHRIIGKSPTIETAKAIVRRVAGLNLPDGALSPNVLITGETGTGKDLFAQAIHYERPERDGPFVQINCAALPDSLVESELFGHVQGAFTDARSSKRGLFELADGGTLFLNEVGSMSLSMQAKLLSAIETRRIRPIGSTCERTVHVQVIAAMNQDPAKEVRVGRFRSDLYHRLRVVEIHLPPLRQRGRDSIALARHFVSVHCRNFRMPALKLPTETEQAIRRYPWPGNVRELSHRLETAVLLSNDGVLDLSQLPTDPKCASDNGNGSTQVYTVDFSQGPISIEQIERDVLQAALAASDHNVSRAAELLCMSRDTVRYRVEKYGLSSGTGRTARQNS